MSLHETQLTATQMQMHDAGATSPSLWKTGGAGHSCTCRTPRAERGQLWADQGQPWPRGLRPDQHHGSSRAGGPFPAHTGQLGHT